jgi:hypothetical protein
VQQICSLLDHLVGQQPDRVRHVDAERPGGCRLMANSNLVDCETDRSLGLKDLASVDPGLTMHVEKIGPVTHHPPTLTTSRAG